MNKRDRIEELLQDLKYDDLLYIQGVLDVLIRKKSPAIKYLEEFANNMMNNISEMHLEIRLEPIEEEDTMIKHEETDCDHPLDQSDEIDTIDLEDGIHIIRIMSCLKCGKGYDITEEKEET